MLALIETELELLADGEIPQTHGHMVHGLFFRVLRRTEPDLCDSLHGVNGTLPFTLSTLYDSGEYPGMLTPGTVKGKQVCFRIGLFDDNLVTAVPYALSEAMIAGPVAIAGIPMNIKTIRVLKTEKIDDIEKNAAVLVDRLRTFRIDFQTFTSFRSEGRSLLFPEPRLIVTSLYRSWVTAGGHKVLDEVLGRIVRKVYPARYDLHTGVLNMGRYFLNGFAGFCVYEAEESMTIEERLVLLNLLGMIPYAGIGYKTTMGMGQARYRVIAEKDAHNKAEINASHAK